MAGSSENGGDIRSRQGLTGLAANLSRLPGEKKRAALEASALLAGVSLRVSREFVAAVPDAADVLSAEELREWAELGRRLAMGNIELGVAYFSLGAASPASLPPEARTYLFRVCTRQLVLSSATAMETYSSGSRLAEDVPDPQLLTEVLRLAAEVAQRSARHSADLIAATPRVMAALGEFGPRSAEVGRSMLELGSAFALRTGGMAADLWSALPNALGGLAADDAVRLAAKAGEVLEFGGSVTLNFVSAGSEVLRRSPGAFNAWCGLFDKIARRGNAIVIAFLRSTPRFFSTIGPAAGDAAREELIGRVLQLTGQIAETDAESALAAFRSSAAALAKVSLQQFEEWIETGLREMTEGSQKARRSYFALETRQSNEQLREMRSGLTLENVQGVLRIYVEGLTGREIEIAQISDIPQGSRIGDGKTIYMPAAVDEFDDDELDFKLYKVLAAHGAGQIEFGTFAADTPELAAAYDSLYRLYRTDEREAFSLGGYLEDAFSSRSGGEADPALPTGGDHRAVLRVFPEPALARRIFGAMENARIDRRLRHAYRGIRKDLDLMQEYLKRNRPYIFDVPAHLVPFELLFQIALCGSVTDDARHFYGQAVTEIEAIVDRYLNNDGATVADSLMATSRVYDLFQNVSSEQTAEATDSADEPDESAAAMEEAAPQAEPPTDRQGARAKQDIRDLFNAWNSLDEDGTPDDLGGAESWTHADMPEQALEAGDIAFAYDEWDRELNDHRVGWSRVIEKKVRQGDRGFVELVRSRYRGTISSIRHQFQLMKPENLTRVNRELDGEDYDLNAVVDLVIDRRADGRHSENIYTKRLRKQRDVAVSILLDQSSSTARTISRNPLQPYTYPGRRIIEIEKEGLVLMSEALEAVGDVYSINGFTSEGRRNVKFYVVKDFEEKYSEAVERRIGGISFQNNTRLGAAVRHAAHRLLRQDARTKLLIILTDGRPYDHDYGDARYAREDVREALTEAKTSGITPFCITIDRESEAELRDLYGDVGYTIIDDVLSLPERMPNIYRRLTS
jgi:nitric oxide reductase NorD protein